MATRDTRTGDLVGPSSARTGADEQSGAALGRHLNSLAELRDAVNACRRCSLWRNATQGVPGEGTEHAEMMFIGEQPGDAEDLAGHPFVGPAGAILDHALIDAGIDRRKVFVTNAVKHFKFEERGKRRIHKTPSRTEVVACRPWLLAEFNAISPEVVVLLGATAAKALMGSSFRLTSHRGEVMRLPAENTTVDLDTDPAVVATVHPSSVLRGPPENREEAFDALVADLRVVASLM